MNFIKLSNIPSRINRSELKKELAEIGVTEVFFLPERTQTRAGDTVTVLPAMIEVCAPDGVGQDQVQAVLDAHSPGKSDTEKETEVKLEEQREMKSELRAYLIEFLRDPELVSMLKAALR